MKRLILYVAILAVTWVLPTQRVDVAQLRPVEVVTVYKQGDKVILATDTGDLGVGGNVDKALENMRSTTPAVIYLDTAQYLLIEEGAEAEAERLQDALKGSTMICVASGKIDLKEAAQYLPVHGDLPQIRTWKQSDNLPVLQQQNGRLFFLEKQDKGA